tara:strand:- start:8 stop:304 length:297 start_codon:yes stop_codon:yes gene_type:complete
MDYIKGSGKVNYKISKETCCKMCGQEINLKEPAPDKFEVTHPSFLNVMKLSSIRMYDSGEFIECSEHGEDAFYFHPDCARALLPENHFIWLKGGRRPK